MIQDLKENFSNLRSISVLKFNAVHGGRLTESLKSSFRKSGYRASVERSVNLGVAVVFQNRVSMV